MTDVNENVQKAQSLSGRISMSLAEKHAHNRASVLHALLSDAAFYDALSKFSTEFGLKKPGNKVESEFLDDFIVTRLLEQNKVDVEPKDDEFTRERKARRFFNTSVSKLLDEHGVPQKFASLIKEYIVLNSVNIISSKEEISVGFNKQSGELVLTLSPELSKADLVSQLSTIFKYWENQRGKITNPKYFSAKQAAELSREKENASYGSLAKKHVIDEATVKKRIERIRKKRESLISDTL